MSAKNMSTVIYKLLFILFIFRNTSKIKELIDDDGFDRNGDKCLLAGEKVLSVNSDKTNDGIIVSLSQDTYSLGQNISTESGAKSTAENPMILYTTNGSNSTTFADKNVSLIY